MKIGNLADLQQFIVLIKALGYVKLSPDGSKTVPDVPSDARGKNCKSVYFTISQKNYEPLLEDIKRLAQNKRLPAHYRSSVNRALKVLNASKKDSKIYVNSCPSYVFRPKDDDENLTTILEKFGIARDVLSLREYFNGMIVSYHISSRSKGLVILYADKHIQSVSKEISVGLGNLYKDGVRLFGDEGNDHKNEYVDYCTKILKPDDEGRRYFKALALSGAYGDKRPFPSAFALACDSIRKTDIANSSHPKKSKDTATIIGLEDSNLLRSSLPYIDQVLTWRKKGQPLEYFKINDKIHKIWEQRSIFAAKVMADRLDRSKDRVAAIIEGAIHVGTIQRELFKRGYSVVTVVTRSVGWDEYVEFRLLERMRSRRFNTPKPKPKIR